MARDCIKAVVSITKLANIKANPSIISKLSWPNLNFKVAKTP